jgi:hypothetical protein
MPLNCGPVSICAAVAGDSLADLPDRRSTWTLPRFAEATCATFLA